MSDVLASTIIYALIALVGLLAACYGAAMQRRKRGIPEGRGVTAQISWLGTYTQAFQRALDVLAELEAELIDADADRGYILASTKLTLPTFGSMLRITIRTQEGVTFVEVQAAPALFRMPGYPDALKRFLVQWEALPAPAPNA